MNRLTRVVLAFLIAGGVAGLVELTDGPRSFVVGSFVLYAFAAGILLRYPAAVYEQREGAAGSDAVWLAVALCGLGVGLPVLQGHSTAPETSVLIFVLGLLMLGIALGYWAADAEI